MAPAKKPLGALAFMMALVRNPLTVWPEEVCKEWVYVQELPGQTIAFVTDPKLLEVILQNKDGNFPKNPLDRRLFGRIFGEGMITAEGDHWRWQRTTAAPQVNPPPNATIARICPGCTRPSLIASQRARGIEEAEVFPNLSMMTITFSGGIPMRRAVASMMRVFA